MIDETVSAYAEGEALLQPAEITVPPPAAISLPDLAERVRDAINRWYLSHFHRATVAGRPPISDADKDELHKLVQAATQPQEH